MLWHVLLESVNVSGVDNLGPLVLRLREERGLTQEDVAAAADVSTSTISRIERGLHPPELPTLRRLAQVLEVPLIDLIEAQESSD